MTELDAEGTLTKVEFPPQVTAYLEQLVEIGIFGTTVEEVIQHLVHQRIEDLLKGSNPILQLIQPSQEE